MLPNVCPRKNSRFGNFNYNILFLRLAGKFAHLKRRHVAGLLRQPLQISSLEDKIALDNLIFFIEAFAIKTILILLHKKRGH